MPTQNDDISSSGTTGENLNGLGGNDTIIGNGGNDTLSGSGGNDTIYGDQAPGDKTVLLQSKFLTGSEGWGFADGGPFAAFSAATYNSGGGNTTDENPTSTDGNVSGTDAGGGAAYFIAPSSYHGDLSAAIGGQISFDLYASYDGTGTSGNAPNNLGAGLVIKGLNANGNPINLYYQGQLSVTDEQWVTNTIDLSASSFNVSQQDFEAVMSSVTDIRILGEYFSYGGDTDSSYLDNVVVTAPADTQTYAGDDALNGNLGNDTIYGGDGDDSISGGIGNDTIDGGTGDDIIYGEGQANIVNASNTFDNSSEGWRTGQTLSATQVDATYLPTGHGTNNGAIEFVDTAGGTGYFIAPDEYLGDQSSMSGGAINFSQYLSLAGGPNNNPGPSQIVLRGSAGTLNFRGVASGSPPTYAPYQLVDGQWVNVEAPLTEGSWYINGTTTVATQAQIDAVLADLTQVAIKAEYSTSPNDGGRLDSFKFTANSDYAVSDEGLAPIADDDIIEGGAGNDTVFANSGDDVVTDTGGGDDSIYGQGGNDTLSSGTGDDTVSGGTGNDTLNGEAGNDLLIGGDGNDAVDGGTGNDTIYGGGDSDTIAGGDGDDLIYGGLNTTGGTLHLGEISYRFGGRSISDDNVRNTLEIPGTVSDGDSFWVIAYDGGNSVKYTKAIRLEVQDLGNGDFSLQPVEAKYDNGSLYTTLNGDYQAIQNHFNSTGNAMALADSVTASGYGIHDVTIAGESNGGDYLSLTTPTTFERSDDAADIIDGGAGNDTVFADAGDDTVTDTGGGADTIYGEAGNDSLSSGAGDDIVSGGIGNDTINGEAGEDLLIGGDGDDTIDGGTGNDTIYGDGVQANPIENDGQFVGSLADSGWTVTTGGTAGSTATIQPDGSVALDTGGQSNTSVTISNDLGETYHSDQSYTIDLDYWTNDDVPSRFYVRYYVTSPDGSTSLYLTQKVDYNPPSTPTHMTYELPANEAWAQYDGWDMSVDIVAYSLNAEGTAGTESIFVKNVEVSSTDPDFGLDLAADSDLGGDDIINGGLGDDLIYGQAGDDTIDGGAGADVIDGGIGDDSITVGAGDYAAGGDDRDTFTLDPTQFTANGQSVTIDGGTGSTATGDVDDYDEIILNGLTKVAGSYQGSIDADSATAESRTGSIQVTDGTNVYTINFTEIEGVICFARGTLINTIEGDIPVENLKVGDLVLTKDDGYLPIRWIKGRAIPASALAENPKLCPIRIAKGALGKNYPSSDLYVSPQHRILVQSKIALRMFGEPEVLIPAVKLLAFEGVETVTDLDEVEYFHFMFDEHQIVYANGTEAESLFTGPEALKSVTPEARQEILEIFPELDASNALPHAARYIPTQKQLVNLMGRHLKKNKPIHSR